MEFEATFGNDASLVATAADLALNAARSNALAASFGNRAFTNLPVTPGTLSSTETTTTIAAGLFTPKGSGLFQVNFNVAFSMSIADTLGFAAFSVTGATASGGIAVGVTGAMTYETSGHPITVTGSAGGSAGAWDADVPVAAINPLTAQISGPIVLPVGQVGCIGLSMATVGGSVITFTSLTFLIYELP